jgi:transcriptional regulator with GAF, ATPase, and Fis domain
MKDKRYFINLYIIIPVIFAGIALLSVLISYRVVSHYLAKGLRPEWPLAFWALVLVLFTLTCGLLIVKFLIDPIKRFVAQTQSLGVVRPMGDGSPQTPPKNEISTFETFFEQVTELLSKVEARELFPNIVGQSKAIRSVLNQLLKVAPSDASVLVMGETGTGKELVAEAIHGHSQRRHKPWVAINCAAIPEGLLESELFGHEKGAFTGATAQKPGKFEAAHGGTIFLDEIGDMPLDTQAKVLRALEEKQIQRVGAITPIKVDVRFITATNRDLEAMVKAGRFRQDLFFRLSGFTIQLPPLRKRREDIPLLVDHFLEGYDPRKRITPQTLQQLMAHDWPGNVRELQNMVKSAALLAGDRIEPHHLPATIQRSLGVVCQELANPESGQAQNNNLDHRLSRIEKGMIIEALARCGGVQVQAAKILGIKERSLWHRIRKYEIDVTAIKKNR